MAISTIFWIFLGKTLKCPILGRIWVFLRSDRRFVIFGDFWRGKFLTPQKCPQEVFWGYFMAEMTNFPYEKIFWRNFWVHIFKKFEKIEFSNMPLDWKIKPSLASYGDFCVFLWRKSPLFLIKLIKSDFCKENSPFPP